MPDWDAAMVAELTDMHTVTVQPGGGLHRCSCGWTFDGSFWGGLLATLDHYDAVLPPGWEGWA